MQRLIIAKVEDKEVNDWTTENLIKIVKGICMGLLFTVTNVDVPAISANILNCSIIIKNPYNKLLFSYKNCIFYRKKCIINHATS